MNNNFFAFARYLRDEGIDAHLYEVPNSSMEHFRPYADTFEDITSFSWIHTIKLTSKTWFTFNKKKLKEELNQYDLIITCGLASAFVEKIDLQSDIIIPYGADLYATPFKQIKFEFSLNFIKSFFWKNQAKYQKKAYQNARCVITNFEHPLYKNAISSLGVNGINYGMPMLYNKEKVKHKVTKFDFLDNHDFIVFNHSRQVWCTNPDKFKDFNKFKGNKRNDKTIRAFATFLKTMNFQSPILVLFEYGLDVECSKKLIRELNIEKYVKWIPKSYRKEILFGLSKASLAVDQVRENICGIGGTSYEIMASGIPLITYTNGALQNPKHLFFKSPIVEALTEEDILNIFIDYEKNPQNYKEIGQKSKEWFDKNLGLGLARKYVKLMELLVSEKSLTQHDKTVRDIFEN